MTLPLRGGDFESGVTVTGGATFSGTTAITHNGNTIVNTSSKVPIGRLPTQSSLTNSSSYVPLSSAVYSAISNVTTTIDVIANTQTATTGTYSLNSGYSFSDYDILHFIFYSTSDTRYRSWSIPRSAFVKYVNFSLSDNTANTGRYMYFSYASDTSYTIGSNAYIQIVAIYGQKN